MKHSRNMEITATQKQTIAGSKWESEKESKNAGMERSYKKTRLDYSGKI
jgi:hypothetical protein